MNNKKNYSTENNNTKPSKYVGAPYNFVKLSKQVIKKYDSADNMPGHDLISDELLSGEIEYTVTPETDIFIGGTDGKNFYRSDSGKLAIPGSSFRGLMRNNVQILGQCSIGDDIDDYRIMYRNIAGKGALKDYYTKILGVKSKQTVGETNERTTVSICENVKAGYLCRENGGYVIYGTDNSEKDANSRNYYYIRCSNMKQFCPDGLNDAKGNTIVTNVSDPHYIPFSAEISYNTQGKKVVSVGKPGKYSKKGYLVGSGPMKNKDPKKTKKALYVVPEINMDIAVNVDQKSIDSFKRDYEMKKNTLGTTCKSLDSNEKKMFKEYFSLPEKEMKPVFYIEYDGVVYFGFTPYLRIFYKYSVADGLPEQHKKTAGDEEPLWDYAKSMFGFSNQKVSYKSRVYFTDAEYEGTENTKNYKYVLGEPKPSSYHDYIVQKTEGEIKTYNDDGFMIRGYKQYWLRDTPVQSEDNAGDNVSSTIPALCSNKGVFKGKIRFKNLYPDELGLLLCAADMGENYSYNIGKGKPYGLGRIKVNITSLKTFDNSRMYSTDSFCFDPVKTHTAEEISEYKNKFEKILDASDENVNVKGKNKKKNADFRVMKDTTKLPPVEKIRYMDIGNKEYQNREAPLPLPAAVVRSDTDNSSASDNKDNGQNNMFGNFVIKTRGKKQR